MIKRRELRFMKSQAIVSLIRAELTTERNCDE
jgi:hypothetical protein